MRFDAHALGRSDAQMWCDKYHHPTQFRKTPNTRATARTIRQNPIGVAVESVP
jgi:hypothetical protein